MFLYAGRYLLFYEFDRLISGVCSPYAVSCDFVYYVVR